MILVDTSIWIDHLRSGSDDLAVLLNDDQIMAHPFVIGEIALGNLNNRAEVLAMLQMLPMVSVATDTEVLFFIEQKRLAGHGIGYVDAHLLTAVALRPSTCLWTRDRKLLDATAWLELEYNLH